MNCVTCRDSGFVREVFDAGWTFTPAHRHDVRATPCPECVPAVCENYGLAPHPRDKFALCPCCEHYAVQLFQGRQVLTGLSDDDQLYDAAQMTCSREACSNTYSVPLGALVGVEPLTVLERREERSQCG